MKLDFIIIGGQKCGSTYLHKVINEHPDIQTIAEECPHFESPDYENGGVEKLEKTLSVLDNDKIIGIKRPSYLCIPDVAKRIKTILPKVKLILIIRNPIERFKSAYFHYMWYGFIPTFPLNKGTGRLLNGDLYNQFPRSRELLEFGFYYDGLKEYLRWFNEKSILILTYDELKNQKLNVIKKCYSFLEVNENFIPNKTLNTRPQKVNYSLMKTRILVGRNRFKYTYNADKTRLFVKQQSFYDKMMLAMINFFDNHLLKHFFDSENKPAFDDFLQRKILDVYHQDIEKLELLLNIDLSTWKQR